MRPTSCLLKYVYFLRNSIIYNDGLQYILHLLVGKLTILTNDEQKFQLLFSMTKTLFVYFCFNIFWVLLLQHLLIAVLLTTIIRAISSVPDGYYFYFSTYTHTELHSHIATLTQSYTHTKLPK